jgi:hypothetical protein
MQQEARRITREWELVMEEQATWDTAIRRVFELLAGLAAIAGLACLAACGGGGSVGGGVGTVPEPSGPTLTASGSTVSITVAPTPSTPNPSVGLTIADAPTSGLYYTTAYLGSAVQSVNLAWDPALANGKLSGSLVLQLYLPEFIGSGTYHDTVTVKVCQDSKCDTQIAGSPLTIAVTYTVTGNAVSDASYAITPTLFNLEVPSTGTAPTAAVNVTAYEVPPYGAYVHYSSQTGGAVASISFKANSTDANDYATGTLTINLKPPDTLGPGFYSDVVTMSICYDDACTKPAAGSPWSIPVTYTVTASAGREFQQQIVALDLTALAADPSGTTLYGTTQLTNATAAQLVRINPVSGAVTASLDLDDDISQMAVSQDGQYIYLASLGAQGTLPHVMRVNASSMTLDFSLFPTVLSIAPMTVSVSPQNSRTWSLAFLDQGNSATPAAYTVEVFDDNVARPDAWSLSSDVVYGNQAQWSSDGSTIFVRDLNLTAVTVTPAGLGTGTQLPTPDQGIGLGAHTIQQVGNLLYSGGGGVVDPTADSLLGKYVFRTPSSTAAADSAGLAIDTANNRTFAAYADSEAAGVVPTLESFNRSQFDGLWIARLPVAGTPVRWGTNGLAFIASNPNLTGPKSLYLITGTFVAP